MIKEELGRQRFSYGEIFARLVGFINLICEDEAAIPILLGTLPAPSSLDIYYLKKGPSKEAAGCRVDGGEDVPLQEVVITATQRENELLEYLGRLEGPTRSATANGWRRINGAFRDFKERYPETWTLFEDHVNLICKGGKIHDGKGGMTITLSKKNDGVVGKTLRRRRNLFVRRIAVHILSWHPQDNEFDLR